MRINPIVAMSMLALMAMAAPLDAREPDGGVKIGNPSVFRRFVPASWMENQAAQQYLQLTQQASQSHTLLPEGDPKVERVRAIARALLPHTLKFNPRAKDWDWEVNVVDETTVNAFCMPGGKIVVYSGIIDQLDLTDDELALVVGHEIGHALREHSRARQAKETLTNLGVMAVGAVVGGNAGEIARVGGGLLTLKFSRHDETEADLVGMELAARAGYDPRAGISLWKKMSEASQGEPFAWMSTHPSSATRVQTFKDNLKDVMPIYEEVRAEGHR